MLDKILIAVAVIAVITIIAIVIFSKTAAVHQAKVAAVVSAATKAEDHAASTVAPANTTTAAASTVAPANTATAAASTVAPANTATAAVAQDNAARVATFSVYVLDDNNTTRMGALLGSSDTGTLLVTNPSSNTSGFYLYNTSSSTISSVAVSSPSFRGTGVWTYLADGPSPWETWYGNFTTTLSVKPGKGLIINNSQFSAAVSTISFNVKFMAFGATAPPPLLFLSSE